MRSLGQFARTEELQQMLQEVDADGKLNLNCLNLNFLIFLLRKLNAYCI